LVFKGFKMKTVIFACVHSAGRSQMAAAFFRKHANPSLLTATAAGTEPASKVHPEVLEVMQEVGIDLSKAKPTLLTQELAQGANLLVTMGCGEKCPYVVGLKIVDWSLKDPKGQGLENVRVIRDEIERLVLNLIEANGWG
jgi:arsenate reductase